MPFIIYGKTSILKLQKEKSRLFEDLISDDSGSLKNLTQEDIEYILGE